MQPLSSVDLVGNIIAQRRMLVGFVANGQSTPAGQSTKTQAPAALQENEPAKKGNPADPKKPSAQGLVPFNCADIVSGQGIKDCYSGSNRVSAEQALRQKNIKPRQESAPAEKSEKTPEPETKPDTQDKSQYRRFYLEDAACILGDSEDSPWCNQRRRWF